MRRVALQRRSRLAWVDSCAASRGTATSQALGRALLRRASALGPPRCVASISVAPLFSDSPFNADSVLASHTSSRRTLSLSQTTLKARGWRPGADGGEAYACENFMRTILGGPAQ